MFLTRGGRPRRNPWWRAWVARLLPIPADELPPHPVSAALAAASGILSITFDASIDEMTSDVEAAQFRLTDGVSVFPGIGFDGLAGAVLRVQMDLPGSMPLELTCSLIAGAGVVRGVNGAPVAPFSGLAVTIG